MMGMIGLLLVAASPAASAQTTPASGGPVSATVIEAFIAANRILVAEGVLDANGHASIRHPSNLETQEARGVASRPIQARDIAVADRIGGQSRSRLARISVVWPDRE
jgi:hypothetical protein